MKRICIYLVYDRDCIVDAYIGHMMKELRTCVDHLAVVCNMPEVARGREHLERYADELFFRENVGFDAGGFKDALCTYIGWERLGAYDELLLVNDSFFGPFVPMRKIFLEMESEEADFWGLLRYAESGNDDGRHLPEHIQSFFMEVRSRLLHSGAFRDYWETLPYYGTFDEVVLKHEVLFTQHFAKKGFRYRTYADDGANIVKNWRMNYNQYGRIPYELIKKRNFPFLKKKALANNDLAFHTQEGWRQAFEYIRQCTDYDIDLIYENIIRTMDISDLQRRLCLNFIAGKGQRKVRKQEQAGNAGQEQAGTAWKGRENFAERASKAQENFRKALAVWIQHDSSYEEVTECLEGLAVECDVFLFMKSDICRGKYRNSGFSVFPFMQGEAVKKLAAYDYVCVLHDADMASDRQPGYIGKSDFYRIWENLLGGGESGYLEEVAGIFEENPKLGILTIPHANFGPYFGAFGRGWDGHYEAVRKAAEKYGFSCRLDEQKPPFERFEDYWIRGELFTCLEDAGEDFMEELPYLWPYIAQGRGYLSGILESVAYAGMDAINLRCHLDRICMQIRHQFGGFQNTEELREVLSRRAVADYCRLHGSVYVYGTGNFAEKYSPYIPDIEAYVVTDGRPKAEAFKGKEVLYLSEAAERPRKGIVVCLDRKNREQVLPLLEKEGFHDYLCV